MLNNKQIKKRLFTETLFVSNIQNHYLGNSPCGRTMSGGKVGRAVFVVFMFDLFPNKYTIVLIQNNQHK